MKEFPLKIQGGLTRGLRPEKFNARNSELLVQCQNMRPTKFGLAAHDDMAEAPIGPGSNLVEDGTFDTTASWSPVNGWTIAGGKATHTPTIGMPLWQDIGVTNNTSRTYRLTYEVKDCTVGAITPAIQFTAGTERSANGTYTEDIIHDGASSPYLVLLFWPSVDFDGAIDNVVLRDVAWPWPQIFKGKEATLECARGSVFVVDETDWSVAKISTYDSEAMGTTKGITTGGVWHFADMGTAWLLFNGACVVLRTNLHNVQGLSYPDEYFVYDGATIATGCYFRGRIVYGGFGSGTTHPVWGSLAENYVMWTQIGGGEVFWPFFPNLPDDELEDFYIKRNEWAAMAMPWQGQVLCVKALDRAVMVYGENGVSVLVPGGPQYQFGLKHIMSIGIQGRGAVGGDEQRHVFVDKLGEIWSIDANLKLTRHGYKELFEDKLSETIVISHDQRKNVFYICSDTVGYVLTEDGLGQLANLPSSLIYSRLTPTGDEQLVGAFYNYVANSTFELTLDTFDMNLAALKTLQTIMVSAQEITGLEVGVDYRYNGSDTFSSGDWLVANEEGWVMPQITARDFRIKLKGTLVGESSRIDYLNLGWKLSDKRGVRFAYT